MRSKVNFYCTFIYSRGSLSGTSGCSSYRSLSLNEFKTLYAMTDKQFYNFTIGKSVTLKSKTNSGKWVLKKSFIVI